LTRLAAGPDLVACRSGLGDLERHRLGDAFDGVLTADIDRGPRRTPVPVGRGDVDNATAALPLNDAHFVLHAQDHAENIRLERRGIAFRGLVRDRAAGALFTATSAYRMPLHHST
jgi:hypothetical protein